MLVGIQAAEVGVFGAETLSGHLQLLETMAVQLAAVEPGELVETISLAATRQVLLLRAAVGLGVRHLFLPPPLLHRVLEVRDFLFQGRRRTPLE